MRGADAGAWGLGTLKGEEAVVQPAGAEVAWPESVGGEVRGAAVVSGAGVAETGGPAWTRAGRAILRIFSRGREILRISGGRRGEYGGAAPGGDGIMKGRLFQVAFVCSLRLAGLTSLRRL